jgi:hypothetical protein
MGFHNRPAGMASRGRSRSLLRRRLRSGSYADCAAYAANLHDGGVANLAATEGLGRPHLRRDRYRVHPSRGGGAARGHDLPRSARTRAADRRRRVMAVLIRASDRADVDFPGSLVAVGSASRHVRDTTRHFGRVLLVARGTSPRPRRWTAHDRRKAKRALGRRVRASTLDGKLLKYFPLCSTGRLVSAAHERHLDPGPALTDDAPTRRTALSTCRLRRPRLKAAARGR